MTKEAVDFRTLYQLVDERTQRIMECMDKLENRVSILERWQSNLTGKLAIIVSAAMLVWVFIADWVRKQFRLE